MNVRVDALDATGRVTVGLYPDYRSALIARNADVMSRLCANGGYRIRVDHAILEPAGGDGEDPSGARMVEQLLSCQLGVDPRQPEPPTLDDLVAACDWLTTTTSVGTDPT